MSYSLKVKKSFEEFKGGRIFLEGHDCSGLDAFEVAELVTDHPDAFEAGDELTSEFIKNSDNLKHLSDAAKRKNAESGGVTGSTKARKQ